MAFWQHFFGQLAAGDASNARIALSDRNRELNSEVSRGWSALLVPIVAAGQTFADFWPVPTTTITAGVAVLPPGWLGAIAASLTLTMGLTALLFSRRALSPTTLTAAWWWTLTAVIAWGFVEIAAAVIFPVASKPWLEPLRLAAVTLSFCPVVALIGAKRPQHAAWNFVVLALWGIVALPAAEAFFLHRGQRIDMGDARGWFLWILVLLTPINFVPTRFWLASLLVAAGQMLALAPYLPLMRQVGPSATLSDARGLLAYALCACGVFAAWAVSRRNRITTNPYDRLWLDFRDSLGLFWALRVQERIQAAAQQYGWDLDLTWSGFRRGSDGAEPGTIDPAIEPALRTTFKGLLRRFVSNAWIATRLG